ncbi:bis(5'-nucleosyl)-tetraphosphatase [Metamycoplasma neophronis]|uniref:Bis(5'-nucleosyl)-tetraphosphatase [asymmetrical] n=1 Tax=Metamycoplasma neophronis TaxID=872983 RepID=A0ABY2YZU3_9BACT|nr:NUDIX domain-containing protein [Metamycoplasma neophronis]TPR53363.1 NUDIX domain-containing protein [Metamycoplasma neophronis]
MKKEKSCGAVILREINGRLNVLLIEQKAGHWGFPKGHVEGKESEVQTAIREIKEETNLDVTLIKDFKVTTKYSPFPLTMKEVVYFLAFPLNNNLIKQEEEINVVSWVPVRDAELYKITYESDINVLNKAIEYYFDNIHDLRKLAILKD